MSTICILYFKTHLEFSRVLAYILFKNISSSIIVREYFDDQTVQMEVRRGIQFLSEQDAEDVMSVFTIDFIFRKKLTMCLF